MRERHSICVENNPSGKVVYPVLVEVCRGVEWQIPLYEICRLGSIEARPRRFWRLQHQIDRVTVILGFEVLREELHINLLRVVEILNQIPQVSETPFNGK